SVHLSKHDVDAAENNHHVGDGLTEAHVFEHRQVDEAWRADQVAVRIRTTITDEVKAEFALRPFNPAIGFARFRAEATQLRFRIDDRASRNFGERLV